MYTIVLKAAHSVRCISEDPPSYQVQSASSSTLTITLQEPEAPGVPGVLETNACATQTDDGHVGDVKRLKIEVSTMKDALKDV